MIRIVLALSLAALSSGLALAQAVSPTSAKADGKGNVTVHIAYLAENACVDIAEVKEGAPASIERPKRTLTVTVVLDRPKQPCSVVLRTIDRDIVLKDDPAILSVDIFYVDKDGTFVRSARPRIYRQGDLEETDE